MKINVWGKLIKEWRYKVEVFTKVYIIHVEALQRVDQVIKDDNLSLLVFYLTINRYRRHHQR